MPSGTNNHAFGFYLAQRPIFWATKPWTRWNNDDRRENGAVRLTKKQAERDLVREMLAYAAARIMEVEVELRTGAANGTRSPLREVQRIGYREWDRDVLVGTAASGK